MTRNAKQASCETTQDIEVCGPEQIVFLGCASVPLVVETWSAGSSRLRALGEHGRRKEALHAQALHAEFALF